MSEVDESLEKASRILKRFRPSKGSERSAVVPPSATPRRITPLPPRRRPALTKEQFFYDAEHTVEPPPTAPPVLGMLVRKRPRPAAEGYPYEGWLLAVQYRELARGPQQLPGFVSEADRRRAWRDHRERILQDFVTLGITDRRPWAQDHYEPQAVPDDGV